MKTGHEIAFGSPVASTTRTAHSSITVTVSSVLVYSKDKPSLSHTEVVAMDRGDGHDEKDEFTSSKKEEGG